MQLRVHANIPQHARRFSLTHWLCWPGIESSNITLLAALPELRRTDCCKRLRLRSNMRLFKARLGGVLLGNQMVFSRKLQHGLKWCSRPTTNLSRHGLGYCRSRSVEALKCCWCFRSRSVYGIVWGAAGADLLRHFLWSSRSRSVTALFVVPQEPDLLRHFLWSSRSRSVTAFFVVLQEPICYGIVWGASRADLLRHCLGYCRGRSVTALFVAPGADLLRHFLWYFRSRSVTALFVVLQEPICYGIVFGTSGAGLLRHCLWYVRSRSVTALFVVLQEPSAAGPNLSRHSLGYCRSRSVTALFGVICCWVSAPE